MTSVAPLSPATLCGAKRGRRGSPEADFRHNPYRKRLARAGVQGHSRGLWALQDLLGLYPGMDEQACDPPFLLDAPTNRAARDREACRVSRRRLAAHALIRAVRRHAGGGETRAARVAARPRTRATAPARAQVIADVLGKCNGDLEEALEKLTELSLANSSPKSGHDPSSTGGAQRPPALATPAPAICQPGVRAESDLSRLDFHSLQTSGSLRRRERRANSSSRSRARSRSRPRRLRPAAKQRRAALPTARRWTPSRLRSGPLISARSSMRPPTARTVCAERTRSCGSASSTSRTSRCASAVGAPPESENGRRGSAACQSFTALVPQYDLEMLLALTHSSLDGACNATHDPPTWIRRALRPRLQRGGDRRELCWRGTLLCLAAQDPLMHDLRSASIQRPPYARRPSARVPSTRSCSTLIPYSSARWRRSMPA